MTEYDNLSTNDKHRIALHKDVNSICMESCHHLGLEITHYAMAIVGELVYKKLSDYGPDLEAFAKHAKRTTINSEDVKLLARRNPFLEAHLNKLCKTNPPASKDKRRKTVAVKPEVPVKLEGKPEVSVKLEGKPEVSAKKKHVNVILSDDSDCIEVKKPKKEEI